MMTIHKQVLQMVDEQSIEIPYGAKVLAVQVQHGVPCIWYRLNTVAALKKRTVYIHGTGHEFAHDAEYIGTFQLQGGALVFHAFIA